MILFLKTCSLGASDWPQKTCPLDWLLEDRKGGILGMIEVDAHRNVQTLLQPRASDAESVPGSSARQGNARISVM